MAVEKLFTLPQGQQLTSEIITNLYLYNQDTTPTEDELLSSDLIRPKLDSIPEGADSIASILPFDLKLSNIFVDSEPYMSSGPGRFANGSQFDLVRAFFGLGKDRMLTDNGKKVLVENIELNPGTYSKKRIDELLFQGQLGGYSSSIELRNYRDNINDYAELVYIWNSSAFSLPDNIEFVVNPNGTREIKNFKIEPNGFIDYNFRENFDFKTKSPIVGLGSDSFLRTRVDPSDIGRTVFIDFYDRSNLPLYNPISSGNSANTYNIFDFNQDLVTESSEFNPNIPSLVLELVGKGNELFDEGATKFLYNNKPILYGTVDNDVLLTAASVSATGTPTLNPFKGNGTVLVAGTGNDNVIGASKEDILLGGEGSDTLAGNQGNDTLNGGVGLDELNGGAGEDVAVFTDAYANENGEQNYTFLTEGATTTIGHTIGLFELGIDGIDTLKNIEWGEFKGEQVPIGNARLAAATPSAPRLIPLPLEDGEIETETKQATDTTPNPNPNDLPTPPHVSLSAPVAMLDGNVDFTLNISPYKPDTQYNISYILDTSASMDSGELQQAKDGYINLTNYFINNGLAENINFGVVKFSRNATLYKNLTADQAKSTIQGLTSSPAIEGTEYDNALYEGFNFLSQSPINALNTTNIAYFVSDGKSDISQNFYTDDAQRLRRFSNVQAFGIYDPLDPGGVSPSQINFVDSNNGVLVNNASQLTAELGKSGLAGTVSAVNILVDGVVVDTVQPSELTDSPLGLTYEGSVENLDVSANAKNVVTAEVVFNNNTATTSVDYTINAGDGNLIDGSGNPIADVPSNDQDPLERIRQGSDGNDDLTLGYADRGVNGGAGADYIAGNKRDNQLNGGDGNDTIMGHNGNDTIITGTGTNKVNGGEGIDTAVYGDVAYQGNNISLRQAANTVSYNNTDTLTEVEYLQFSDVRLSAKTLQVTPMLGGNDVTVSEPKSGNATAQFTFNLSTPAPANVQFNYQTVDGDAVAGLDYIAKSGQVTIAAGQTSATVEVEVISDNLYDELTEAFALKLSSITGATFADNQPEYVLAANLENRVQDLNLIGDAQANTFTGGAGDDLIDGQGNNDYLAGEGGNDTLIGGTGIDTLVGASGQDVYFVDHASDVISETSTVASEIDTVQSSVAYTLGTNLENLTLTGTGAISGTGNALNNTITGNTVNNSLTGGDGLDTLNGAAGADTMTGGAGNDTYVVDNTGDSISETSTVVTEIDTVNATVTHTLGSNVENLTLTGTGAINGTGNTLNNAITGNAANNVLSGGTGNDTMRGETGNDTYVVDSTGDSISETSTLATEIDTVQSNLTYTLGTNLEKLTLTGTNTINGTGNTLNNTLMGNSANNTLSGSTGADTMTGGTGNDTYVVDNTGDSISETSNLATEIDIVQSSVTHTLGVNLENLTLTGTSATNGTGNTLNNTITGNAANNSLTGGDGLDTLNGAAGADTMTGGAGNDTYVVDNTGDSISETSTVVTEIDTVQSSVTHTLGANLENLTLTGTSAINGTGNTLNNTLMGNSANNTLSGSTGADTMTGGTGNDTYVVDSTGDSISETSTLATEIDTVQSSVAYTLGANLENLTLTGTGAISGTGNNLNNNLTGNTANNLLDGSTGNDTMTGGTGNDNYVVDSTGDSISETSTTATEIDTVQSSVTHTLGANLENLTLTGTSAINGTGNTLNNTLTGNTANNSLTGADGLDTLNGAAGADTMTGGTGNDTYVVDNAGDVVSETSTVATEIDTIQSSVTYTLGANLENLTLTGTSAINGTGNALNNLLTGNAAINILTADDGNDTLNGGDGDDKLYGKIGNDSLNGGLGNDYASGFDGLDTLSGNEGNDSLSGGNGDDVLTGDIGDDSLEGGGNLDVLTGDDGNDTLSGGDGDDKLYGKIGNDLFYGGLGNDYASGFDGLDTLYGTEGNDFLSGGNGNDVLSGGPGTDTLVGGTGSDRFIYDTNAAFISSAVGVDLVTDFISGTDEIVLDKTTFTALGSVVGDGFSVPSDFSVVGSDAAAAGANALIVYSSESDNLFYNQNGVTTGLGSGGQFATISGIASLSANDFELQA